MKSIKKHIKRIIEIVLIIISVIPFMTLPVVPAYANSISYDQSHHSYSIIHNNFIEPEGIPTTIGSSFESNQNVVVPSGNMFLEVNGSVAARTGTTFVEDFAVHGNSLKSLKPTWGYKLYSTDGTFLKNGITSAVKAESRYTRAFMSDKVMLEKTLFPNRAAAYEWEFLQNTIERGPLNLNMH